jgi:hypothetical protein
VVGGGQQHAPSNRTGEATLEGGQKTWIKRERKKKKSKIAKRSKTTGKEKKAECEKKGHVRLRVSNSLAARLPQALSPIFPRIHALQVRVADIYQIDKYPEWFLGRAISCRLVLPKNLLSIFSSDPAFSHRPHRLWLSITSHHITSEKLGTPPDPDKH